MHHQSNQTIRCKVQSCRFYGTGDYCTLPAVEVMPNQQVFNGIAEDESFCGSYESLIEL